MAALTAASGVLAAVTLTKQKARVTGSRELLDMIGIEPHASRGGHLRFPHRGVSAGDAFVLEGARIRVIGSPGHNAGAR